MNVLLAVFLGGGTGAMMRHYAVLGAAKMFGEAFPYGTLFVNVLGSFMIGALLEAAALKWQVSLEMRAFMVTGFLGGFTTFSAFSLDFFRLVETGRVGSAALYAAASLALSLLAVFAGVFLLRGVLS